VILNYPFYVTKCQLTESQMDTQRTKTAHWSIHQRKKRIVAKISCPPCAQARLRFHHCPPQRSLSRLTAASSVPLCSASLVAR
jgi:hypothetical protein